MYRFVLSKLLTIVVMKYLVCVFFMLLSINSCSGQSSNSEIFVQEPTVTIQRFDKDLHNYLKKPTDETRRLLEIKYKNFLPAFGRVTINNSDSYKKEFFPRLGRYFSNEMLSKIYDDALKTFEDLSSYEKELSYADNIVAVEFNGKHLPALYMHVSGFKENVMVLDNIISLSADKYLGADYPAYRQFFENFQLIQMQPKMVSRDYLKAWILSEILASKKNPNLLDEMVKEGKLLYTLSVLLPDRESYDLIGYSPEKELWCVENEKKIWQTIVQLNHLYSSDQLLINKYINDAPYTSTLSPDSPGKVGTWVGWNVVKAYVSKNNVSLNQLMAIEPQDLLKGSGYNP